MNLLDAFLVLVVMYSVCRTAAAKTTCYKADDVMEADVNSTLNSTNSIGCPEYVQLSAYLKCDTDTGTLIGSKTDCKAAADELNLSYNETDENSTEMPKGCSIKEGILYFNSHPTGAIYLKYEPICKKYREYRYPEKEYFKLPYNRKCWYRDNFIGSKTDCKAAADKLNLTVNSEKDENSDKMPKGCSINGGILYFNSHPTGGNLHQYEPICNNIDDKCHRENRNSTYFFSCGKCPTYRESATKTYPKGYHTRCCDGTQEDQKMKCNLEHIQCYTAANKTSPKTCDLGITGCQVTVDKAGKTLAYGCSKTNFCPGPGTTRKDGTEYDEGTEVTTCCYLGELSNDDSKRCDSQYRKPDGGTGGTGGGESFGETTAANMLVTGMLLAVGKLFF